MGQSGYFGGIHGCLVSSVIERHLEQEASILLLEAE